MKTDQTKLSSNQAQPTGVQRDSETPNSPKALSSFSSEYFFRGFNHHSARCNVLLRGSSLASAPLL